VRRTLDPIFTGLAGLGLSQTEITRLVSVATASFGRKSILSNLPYYLSLFGSYENLLRALKNSGNTILSSDPERVVKPKVAVLTECGLGACDIAKLCIRVPRMLNSKPEYLPRMVACAEALGVPRGSAMFRHALQGVALRSAEKIASRVENLKNTFRWSDAEVRIAVSKSPSMLMRCKDNLQSRSEFLYSEVGLEPAYIAHRPILLNYSLEGRLRPRYYVVSFLKENGLLDHKRDYYAAVMLSEKVFLEKYIHPYKKTAPHLAKNYADACRGQVPTRFRVALTKDGQ
jgi:mTERF domain-containing protein